MKPPSDAVATVEFQGSILPLQKWRGLLEVLLNRQVEWITNESDASRDHGWFRCRIRYCEWFKIHREQWHERWCVDIAGATATWADVLQFKFPEFKHGMWKESLRLPT